MNRGSFFYRVITLLLGGLMMSFAWPLRGQFGHAWGAAVTGTAAGAMLTLLIPWPRFRQAFAQAAFWGIAGFVLGGENIGYGTLIDGLLDKSGLAMSWKPLLLLAFIGASWGAIGGTYLGYGLSETPPRKRDVLVLLSAGILSLMVIEYFHESRRIVMVCFTALIAGLHIYNRLFIRSRMMFLIGVYGLWGFGVGFLTAVVVLFYGTQGMLPGPQGWWTLRDQIWGGIGGLALMLGVFRALAGGWQPAAILNPWFQRFGFICAGPFVCAINTWNVYEKWFRTDPPAPHQGLAALLIVAGAIFLFIWFLFVVLVDRRFFYEPFLNRLLLGSFLVFCIYLSFFAVAKSVVYAGWAVWEAAFTLFAVNGLLFFMTLPFILLAPEPER